MAATAAGSTAAPGAVAARLSEWPLMIASRLFSSWASWPASSRPARGRTGSPAAAAQARTGLIETRSEVSARGSSNEATRSTTAGRAAPSSRSRSASQRSSRPVTAAALSASASRSASRQNRLRCTPRPSVSLAKPSSRAADGLHSTIRPSGETTSSARASAGTVTAGLIVTVSGTAATDEWAAIIGTSPGT